MKLKRKQEKKHGREVQRVVRSENIPVDIIKFINKYDNSFLQIYDTYNTIYNSRNKNPLYRNLRNRDLAIPDLAIAISSLVLPSFANPRLNLIMPFTMKLNH